MMPRPTHSYMSRDIAIQSAYMEMPIILNINNWQ